MNLIIFGPQGSGKGTQAKLLAEKFGLVHLEMGAVLRKKTEENTNEGRSLGELLNKGELAPSEIVLGIVENYLTTANLEKGIIFEGFPRSSVQLYPFQKMLDDVSSLIDKVIVLQISEKETVRRLSARRICSSCGAIYNLLTQPPKNEEKCDNCGSGLEQRGDETPKTIERRLKIYEQQTGEVINFYRKKGLVIDINGEQPIETIHKEIMQKLGFQ